MQDRDQQRTLGEVIQAELDRRCLTQADLARLMGRYSPEISNLISGKRSVTPEIAIELAAALDGTTPEYWLGLETARQLSLLPQDASEIKKRVRLYQLGPIREMERRNWIVDTGGDPIRLEAELCRFFGVDSLENDPPIVVAARKSNPNAPLDKYQRAWCARARQLASALPHGGFEDRRMASLKRELRLLAAYPAEARRVPDVMREYGIRFVVVEHLPASKVDGAAFWLDERTPAIAVSLRLDRNDNFWFTLIHECVHIERHDAISIDEKMGHDERDQSRMKEAAERQADEGAAAALVPPDELESFVRRFGPIYSKANIIQFAHRIKMHPGIIVGQLQHRAEISFKSHHEMQPKIRAHVISTSLTDGWGVELAPGSD